MAVSSRRPFPVLGDQFPTRGNRFSRAFGRSIVRVLGWEFEGEMPNLAKCVGIFAPHTSNWDAVIGLAAVMGLGVRIRFLAAAGLFRQPLGTLLTWLGGISVEPATGRSPARQVGEEFASRDRLVVFIAPEATRQRVDRWRTGFHRIARAAGVPIVLTYLDYPRKKIGIGPVISPSDDLEADMAAIRAYYAGVGPKRPEHFSS